MLWSISKISFHALPPFVPSSSRAVMGSPMVLCCSIQLNYGTLRRRRDSNPPPTDYAITIELRPARGQPTRYAGM